jgi:hypothetical protein
MAPRIDMTGVDVTIVHHVHNELDVSTEVSCRVIVGFVFVPPGTPLTTGVVLCVTASTPCQRAVLSTLAHNVFVGEGSPSHDGLPFLGGLLQIPSDVLYGAVSGFPQRLGE